MILKDAKQKVEQTYQHFIAYAEARWNVIALEISDNTANIVTSALVALCLGLLGIFFLLFLSISLGLMLGDLLHSWASGFFLVAAFYAILGIVAYIYRQKLLFTPFMNHFLKILYRNQDDKKL
jgi:membrane-bound ClpP family serine protease